MAEFTYYTRLPCKKCRACSKTVDLFPKLLTRSITTEAESCLSPITSIFLNAEEGQYKFDHLVSFQFWVLLFSLDFTI